MAFLPNWRARHGLTQKAEGSSIPPENSCEDHGTVTAVLEPAITTFPTRMEASPMEYRHWQGAAIKSQIEAGFMSGQLRETEESRLAAIEDVKLLKKYPNCYVAFQDNWGEGSLERIVLAIGKTQDDMLRTLNEAGTERQRTGSQVHVRYIDTDIAGSIGVDPRGRDDVARLHQSDDICS